MSTIVFEEPPPSAARRGSPRSRALQVLAAALRDAPGEWARVGTYSTASSSRTTASLIRTGRLSAFAPRGEFEATSRTGGGRHLVYARYVGTNTPAGGEQA